MKVDWTPVLLSPDDKPLLNEAGKPMTFGLACRTALMATQSHDTVDTKHRLGELWLKIGMEPDGDYDHGDIAFIRQRVEETMHQLIILRTKPLFNAIGAPVAFVSRVASS
jgi:hypothetical protein